MSDTVSDLASDPLAWRPIKAPSLVELEILAAEIFRRLPRRFPDRGSARSNRRGKRIRSARAVSGRRPAVPLRKRAGADAEYDLALPPADPRLLGRARRNARRHC